MARLGAWWEAVVRGGRTWATAGLHVGQGGVLKVDLKDFFPTIAFRVVRGVFQSLGYSPAVATILALLCTDAPRRKVQFDGAEWWVATGERRLPQGAPTSPALAHVVTRRLDRRPKGRPGKRGRAYPRRGSPSSDSSRLRKRHRPTGRTRAPVCRTGTRCRRQHPRRDGHTRRTFRCDLGRPRIHWPEPRARRCGRTLPSGVQPSASRRRHRRSTRKHRRPSPSCT